MKSKLAVLPSKDTADYDLYCFVPENMQQHQFDLALEVCKKQAAELHGIEWDANDLRELMLNHNIVVLKPEDILVSTEDWDQGS